MASGTVEPLVAPNKALQLTWHSSVQIPAAPGYALSGAQLLQPAEFGDHEFDELVLVQGVEGLLSDRLLSGSLARELGGHPLLDGLVEGGRHREAFDELGAYNGVGRRVAGGHHTVKHSAKQYVDGKNGEIHSNTAESVFSLIKRGVYGTFHSVSKHHLERYLCEFEFRWNHRFEDDADRTVAAIRGAEGKRLYYRDSEMV